jgi:hypothetical protein
MRSYRLSRDQITDVATGFGACIASDKILVLGERVGYMYRHAPDFQLDSGWRFFGGSETQEYADEPANFALYDVTTVANYDHDIVAFLDAPIGSAYIRDPLSGPLRLDPEGAPGDPPDG